MLRDRTDVAVDPQLGRGVRHFLLVLVLLGHCWLLLVDEESVLNASSLKLSVAASFQLAGEAPAGWKPAATAVTSSKSSLTRSPVNSHSSRWFRRTTRLDSEASN